MIEQPLGPVTTPVEARCARRMPEVRGAIRPPVESGVDPIPVAVESLVDAPAALVEAVIDAVAEVAGVGRRSEPHREEADHGEVPDLHERLLSFRRRDATVLEGTTHEPRIGLPVGPVPRPARFVHLLNAACGSLPRRAADEEVPMQNRPAQNRPTQNRSTQNRIGSKLRFVVALVAASCLESQSALALDLYSVDFAGPATLFRMDQTAGAASPIGAVGYDRIGDLTSDTRPGMETLWGVRIADGEVLDELVTIDPATGAATGSVPISIDTGGAFQGSPGHMTSIAFDPVSGKLYGNTAEAFGAPFDALYLIDALTGAASFVGRITFSNVFSLGFDQAGTLYGIADMTKELISIDLSSGNGSLVAAMQVNFAFDIASRPDDDVMFLVDSGTSSLFTLDVTNGVLTGVGGYGGTLPNLVGLAFAPVPEPGTFLLVASGLVAVARGRRKSLRA